MKRDVVAFIHTYAKDGELGSYMAELVKGFEQNGCKLHLILTNDLVGNLAATEFLPKVSEDKLIAFIKQVDPAFIFSTNRGGITKKMMRELDYPIVTWMVDRIPFLHHGGTHKDLFFNNDYVVTSSKANVGRLEKIYPILQGRVFYYPFCTNIEHFSGEHEQNINISFVGTYFYCGQFTEILKRYKGSDKRVLKNILQLLSDVEHDYDLDFEKAITSYGLESVLVDFNLDIYKFKGLLANVISLNSRVQYLDVISDLGLKLYGTDNWVNVSQFSTSLLRCYQFDEFIKTRQQLVSLYQRSKIAVNVSHHQAVNGLPYRVFDIMASNALLITEYKEDSDLFRLFGENMPVPMYKNKDELRELCKYYLENDAERKKVVKQCNKLVVNGFSFKDRVNDFYSLLGMKGSNHVYGEVERIEVQRDFEHYDQAKAKADKDSLLRAQASGGVTRVMVKGTFTDPTLLDKVLDSPHIKGCFLRKKIVPLGRNVNVLLKTVGISLIHFLVNITTSHQRLFLKRVLKACLPLKIRTGLREYFS